MKEISNNNDSIKGNHIILFMTPQCNPCKNMKLILEKLEIDHSDKANFYTVDTIQNNKLTIKYKIKSVPTTVFRKDNTIKDRFSGFIDSVDLENKLMNLLFDLATETDNFDQY